MGYRNIGEIVCSECVFFHPSEGRTSVGGECRLRPPSMVLANDQLFSWPFVNNADWCGEGIDEVLADDQT